MTLDQLGQIAATVSTALGHPEGAVALLLIGRVVQTMHQEQRQHTTTQEELAVREAETAAARARAKATA